MPDKPDVLLDDVDRLIIDLLQKNFPLHSRPYLVLAQQIRDAYGLEMSEEDVLQRTLQLRRQGYIRRLGAVFEARALGYQSTLCAVRVRREAVPAAAAFINASPAVTHNYLRDAELNIWFTFTARDDVQLETFLERLGRFPGVERLEVFPAEKLFKLKVEFRLSRS